MVPVATPRNRIHSGCDCDCDSAGTQAVRHVVVSATCAPGGLQVTLEVCCHERDKVEAQVAKARHARLACRLRT